MTTNYEAWAEGWKAALKYADGDYAKVKEIQNPYDPEEKPYVNHYYVNNTYSSPKENAKEVEVTLEDIKAKRAAKKRRQEEKNTLRLREIKEIQDDSYRTLEHILATSYEIEEDNRTNSLISLYRFYWDIGELDVARRIKDEIIKRTPSHFVPVKTTTFEEENET